MTAEDTYEAMRPFMAGKKNTMDPNDLRTLFKAETNEMKVAQLLLSRREKGKTVAWIGLNNMLKVLPIEQGIRESPEPDSADEAIKAFYTYLFMADAAGLEPQVSSSSELEQALGSLYRPEFEVCLNVFRGMMNGGKKSQVVSCLGATGSGKSYTARGVIRCMMALDPRQSGIVDNVWKLLALFTTTSTALNSKSSRSGTDLQMSFSPLDPNTSGQGYTIRTHVSIFALERSAMIGLVDERGHHLLDKSFHIIRALPYLARRFPTLHLENLVSKQGIDRSIPSPPASAKATSKLKLDAGLQAESHAVFDWMDELWGKAFSTDVASVLAGIVHLDSMAPDFVPANSDHPDTTASVHGKTAAGRGRMTAEQMLDHPSFIRAAECWQTDVESLVACLVPAYDDGASEMEREDEVVPWGRVKALGELQYIFLVQTLLLRCNVKLGERRAAASRPIDGAEELMIVNVLDMAGFEKFETNAFETFLINHATEAMNVEKSKWLQAHLGTETAQQLIVPQTSWVASKALLDAVRMYNNNHYSSGHSHSFRDRDTDAYVDRDWGVSTPSPSYPMYHLAHHADQVTYDLSLFPFTDRLPIDQNIVNVTLGTAPLARLCLEPGIWTRQCTTWVDHAGPDYASSHTLKFIDKLVDLLSDADEAYFVHCIRPWFKIDDEGPGGTRTTTSVVIVAEQLKAAQTVPILKFMAGPREGEKVNADHDLSVQSYYDSSEDDEDESGYDWRVEQSIVGAAKRAELRNAFELYTTNEAYQGKKAELDVVGKQRDMARSDALAVEAQLVSINAAMDVKDQELQASQTELALTNKALVSAQNELSTCNKALNTAQDDLNGVRAAKTKIEGELTDVRAAKTKIEGELANVRAGKTKIEGELANVRASKTKIEGELTDVRAAKTKMEGELADVRAAKTKMEGELAEVRKEVIKLESRTAKVACRLIHTLCTTLYIDRAESATEWASRHRSKIDRVVQKILRELSSSPEEHRIDIVRAMLSACSKSKDADAGGTVVPLWCILALLTKDPPAAEAPKAFQDPARSRAVGALKDQERILVERGLASLRSHLAERIPIQLHESAISKNNRSLVGPTEVGNSITALLFPAAACLTGLWGQETTTNLLKGPIRSLLELLKKDQSLMPQMETGGMVQMLEKIEKQLPFIKTHDWFSEIW